jgi:hypothetical protein
MRRILIALLMFLLPLTANAAQEVNLRYGVWAGGFQILDIKLRLRFSATNYSAFMDAKPSGSLGKLLPWAGQYVSEGKIVQGTLIPESHEKISAWRGDRSHMKMTYKNGKLVSLHRFEQEDGKTVEREEKIDPKMADDTVDMVTGIVQMFRHAESAGNCNFTTTAYDGKRRFEIKFTDRGIEKLPESKLNIFSQREARACELELIPLLGFKQGKPRGYYKIQEDARALGQMPRVWVASAIKKGTIVPVRMLVKSEYGAVFIHLNDMSVR